MSHTILISDVIELIFLANGESYELDMYSEVTGISQQELIDSADSVEHHTVYEEHVYPDSYYEN